MDQHNVADANFMDMAIRIVIYHQDVCFAAGNTKLKNVPIIQQKRRQILNLNVVFAPEITPPRTENALNDLSILICASKRPKSSSTRINNHQLLNLQQSSTIKKTFLLYRKNNHLPLLNHSATGSRATNTSHQCQLNHHVNKKIILILQNMIINQLDRNFFQWKSFCN